MPMKTLFVMVGERCLYTCGYCAQSAISNADGAYLSRIPWIPFSLDTIMDAIKRKKEAFKRICLQVVSSENVESELIAMLPIWVGLDIPVSLSIRITERSQVHYYFSMGIDRLGFSIDVIDPIAYRQIRKGNQKQDLDLLFQVSSDFPEKVTTHLIIGLGETQKQGAELMQRLIDHRITIGLFPFTPVRGTPLENKPSPPVTQYRELLCLLYWMNLRRLRSEQVSFTSYGTLMGTIEDQIGEKAPPKVFSTSGCAYCYRLYYNDRPSLTKETYHSFECHGV